MTAQEIAMHALTAAIAAALSAAGAGTMGERSGRSQVEQERVPASAFLYVAEELGRCMAGEP